MVNIEIEKKIQNQTTTTINLNLSNNTKCDFLRENISNTKSNPSIQQKQHKQFAFIIEDRDSMAKDINCYFLTGSIKRKLMVKVGPFSLDKTMHMQYYIKPTKRHFDPSLYILHVGTNDLSLEDIPEAIPEQIIAGSAA